jgi:hypothetical protein
MTTSLPPFPINGQGKKREKDEKENDERMKE